MCAALLLGLLGCGGAEPRADARLAFAAWSDSLPLTLPESLFLVAAGGILPLPDGGFAMSDAGSGRIVLVDSGGVFRRALGRRGRGPGELLAPGSLDLLGDDQLAVVDAATMRLARVLLEDGAFLEGVRLPGPATDLRRAPDGFWLASVSLETGTTHARWDSRAQAWTRSGRIPDVFGEYPRLARNLGLSVLAARGDTVWVGLMGENGVRRYVGADTAASDSVDFPRVRRRGVPLTDEAWLRSEMSYEDELGAVSVMQALGVLDDGRVAALHRDLTPVGDSFTQQVFLSVVDPRTGAACADIEVDLSSTGVPAVRFTGNAMLALAERENSAGEPTLWLFRLDLAGLGC